MSLHSPMISFKARERVCETAVVEIWVPPAITRMPTLGLCSFHRIYARATRFGFWLWLRQCGGGVLPAPSSASSTSYTWHQRGQALWRTTGPPINLATFLFSILDSKRRLGTFKVFFGLILLILFSFLMALFFDWKVVRVLMVVGLSSPLSKSSFILFYSWCFCTPKARR